MTRKRGRNLSQDPGYASRSGAPGSHTKRSKRIVHDQHKHHRAEIPPWHIISDILNDDGLPEIRPSKFPNEESWARAVFEDGLDDDTKYTVQGLDGFLHIRCPFSAEANACRCGRHACHVDSLIVAVDGACPHNGTPRATRSSYGVFFGSSDGAEAYNISELIEDNDDYPVHTSQRAELHGAIAAVAAVTQFVTEGGQWPCPPGECEDAGKYGCKVKHVVVKSDSAYLVNSITQHIRKWLTNGWLTASKKPIANRDLWEQLLGQIGYLRLVGAGVDFWLVPREMNEDADELANDALRDCDSEDSRSDSDSDGSCY
ncbi:Ribonuclease H-like domain containing protein [Naviculisporaceae sp. PSN 640]